MFPRGWRWDDSFPRQRQVAGDAASKRAAGASVEILMDEQVCSTCSSCSIRASRLRSPLLIRPAGWIHNLAETGEPRSSATPSCDSETLKGVL